FAGFLAYAVVHQRTKELEDLLGRWIAWGVLVREMPDAVRDLPLAQGGAGAGLQIVDLAEKRTFLDPGGMQEVEQVLDLELDRAAQGLGQSALRPAQALFQLPCRGAGCREAAAKGFGEPLAPLLLGGHETDDTTESPGGWSHDFWDYRPDSL